MRSLSLLLLLAVAVYAQEITDNGYAIPEYDPLPSDGEPTDAEENADWAPSDREMDRDGDEAVVEVNDIDGGKAEAAFRHAGHYHGHHDHHGGWRNGHFAAVHGHGGYPFHNHGRLPHSRSHHGRHFRPEVIVSDRHHVLDHPKKPCNKIVKHVTVHTHAPRRHHHHHQRDSSSSEEALPAPCGCRAHRHHGGHHHHHHSGVHGHHHGHRHGHHGHGFGGYGYGSALAPFI